MKVIYNKLIPFKGFYAITVLFWIFARKELKYLEDTEAYYIMVRHEEIHLAQEKELGFIFFYVLYVIEYIFRLIQYHWMPSLAYRAISFEQEARINEVDPEYLKKRKPYAMWRS